MSINKIRNNYDNKRAFTTRPDRAIEMGGFEPSATKIKLKLIMKLIFLFLPPASALVSIGDVELDNTLPSIVIG